jgi:beta-glucosidase
MNNVAAPAVQSFPKNFTWGFAAAAPQIEGAAFKGGKGESIWDHFSRIPGKIRNGDNLDNACEHYTRFRQDFRLMRSLGVRNYRLSIAWPRIFPEGTGKTNSKGLDFYKRLLDAMKENDIEPWVTMFHWDLPQALETRFGGWRDRRIVDAFGQYADTIVKAFGDRVKAWLTLNEITCFTKLAYGTGQKAPGLKLAERVVNQTAHHALLCHGEGVRAVREHGRRGSLVGLAENSGISVPVTETDPDIRAAEAEFQRDNFYSIDAMFRGGYDPGYLKALGKDAPDVGGKDFDSISLPIDFLGLNIYSGKFVRAGRNGKPETLNLPKSFPVADAPWLFHIPQAMYWGPRHVASLYGVKAIYITENGCGYHDEPDSRGEIIDLHRRELLRNYLGELRRGIRDGNPVKGYFLWSFIDNFEWEDGYGMRFGVVHCDFKSQKRTPKLSAQWYQKVIETNSLV